MQLRFADDLLIFCRADKESLTLLKMVLDEFSNSSGLQANIGKIHIFFGGVNESAKYDLLQIMQFPEGSFPIKYLGIPLIHGDCDWLNMMVFSQRW